MLVKLQLASKQEPYWWHKDNKGIIHKQLMAIDVIDGKEQERAICFIIGPICLRIGWIRKESKL